MTDGEIKGTGNSRYLRSVSNFKALYPTYDDFVAALVAGTLPIDLAGKNSGGWNNLGTALNKANLLTDATAALFGKGASATPNEVLAAIKTYINAAQTTANGRALIAAGSYVGNGLFGRDHPCSLTFNFLPKLLLIPDRLTANGYLAANEVYNRMGRPMVAVNALGIDSNKATTSNSAPLGYQVEISIVGNTISWCSTNSASNQLNSENTTYYWVAIG